MVHQIAFRVDSGIQIGSGHLMRCLTLADAVVAAGSLCHFITRPHDGNLIELIRDRGHAVSVLNCVHTQEYGAHSNPPPHAEWLGGDWREDAKATRELTAAIHADWLVVDHYALDQKWQSLAASEGVRLAIIDDLADREHQAQLLLDQNAGRHSAAYDSLVPDSCIRLIGPNYALLKDQFAGQREAALTRRLSARPRRLLVTLGGVDKDNVTSDVLRALNQISLPQDMCITVVMGEHAPWFDHVLKIAEAMPTQMTVLRGVSNMAELMFDADACVCCAGSTAWECCALGLPMILLVIAENQRPGAQALFANDICFGSECMDNLTESSLTTMLREALPRILDQKTYREYSERASLVTGGSGAKTVACYLASSQIHLREAKMCDAEFVWACRHDGDAWKYYKTPEPTPLESHLRWFEAALHREDLRIYIASSNADDIGYARFDSLDKTFKSAEIGVSLIGTARGSGFGSKLIAQSRLKAASTGIERLVAEVHQSNRSSHSSFLRIGFELSGIHDGFLQLVAAPKS